MRKLSGLRKRYDRAKRRGEGGVLPSVYKRAGVPAGDKLPQYTTLGGYTILYVTRHGETLCAKCASENTDREDPVTDAGTFDEGEPEHCANCYREIESSYGPVSA